MLFISTCSQGLIFSILAFGLYITFRILNFADMSVEGSLVLGGSVCAVLIQNGINPVLAIFAAGVAGLGAGLITGFFHTKLKIQAILSGILTMISLYSINIRIMGKSNISLIGKSTIFDSFSFFTDNKWREFFILLFISILLVFIIDLFFKTQLGLAIRATGDNQQMMKSCGANTDYKINLALMISNSLCAISGALIVQNQGYSDINMGTGTIVIGFSSIVIGESLIKNDSFFLKLITIVLGSICYRFIVLLVLSLGMNPSDLKLFTALVAACLLALPNIKKTFFRKV